MMYLAILSLPNIVSAISAILDSKCLKRPKFTRLYRYIHIITRSKRPNAEMNNRDEIIKNDNNNTNIK